MTLTEFLLARIAEDEADARAARVLSELLNDGDKITTSACEEFADHIARWDPARVIAECETKRRIVDRYVFLYDHGDTGGMRWVLAALALPFADHSDYDEAWRV